MNNTTNLTNTTKIIISILSITDLMNYFDITARGFLISSHTIYFIIVILFRDLQKISYLNMHHTNLIGLLEGILYCAWIDQSTPQFPNKELDNFLCSISEIFWPVFRYARAYSILVLAVYRYLAVFNSQIFMKVIHSAKYNLISAGLAWLISILIFIVSKYSLGTYPSSVMCVDGTTTSLTTSVIYYLITTILGYILPSILVVITYSIVHNKLQKLSENLQSNKSNESKMSSRKKLKERKLAFQLILVNVLDILSIVFLNLVTVNRWVPVLNANFFYLRQLWRICNNICQSIIPLVSLIFNATKINLRGTIFFKNRIVTLPSNTQSNN